MQTLKQFLCVGIRLFVEPFFDGRPRILEWVYASAPVTWSGVWLAMGGTDLAGFPGDSQIADKRFEVLVGFAWLDRAAADFDFRYLVLRRTNSVQQKDGIQSCEGFPQVLFLLIGHAVICQQPFVGSSWRVVLLCNLCAIARFRYQLERWQEKVDIESG